MNFDDILKLIFGGISCFGIICVMFIYTIKLCIEKIAESLQKKYSLKFDKELEKYKNLLIGKNYISKTQYDIEISIYRELSVKFFNLLVSFDSLYTSDYDFDDYHKRDDCDRIIADGQRTGEKLIAVQNCLHENAAFIPKEQFTKYESLRSALNAMYWEYLNEFKMKRLSETIQNEQWNKEREDRIKELQAEFDSLNEDLRDYLKSLSIIN